MVLGPFFNDYIMKKKVNEPLALGSLNSNNATPTPCLEVQDFVTAF